jgi:hypothetical protein
MKANREERQANRKAKRNGGFDCSEFEDS